MRPIWWSASRRRWQQAWSNMVEQVWSIMSISPYWSNPTRAIDACLTILNMTMETNVRWRIWSIPLRNHICSNQRQNDTYLDRNRWIRLSEMKRNARHCSAFFRALLRMERTREQNEWLAENVFLIHTPTTTHAINQSSLQQRSFEWITQRTLTHMSIGDIDDILSECPSERRMKFTMKKYWLMSPRCVQLAMIGWDVFEIREMTLSVSHIWLCGDIENNFVAALISQIMHGQLMMDDRSARKFRIARLAWAISLSEEGRTWTEIMKDNLIDIRTFELDLQQVEGNNQCSLPSSRFALELIL